MQYEKEHRTHEKIITMKQGEVFTIGKDPKKNVASF